MQFDLVGEVIKKGITRKSQKPFVQILVSNGDGTKDTIFTFTKKDYELGKPAKIRVSSFVRFTEEVG